MSAVIGWPEQIAWLMWPNGESQDGLAWIRSEYPNYKLLAKVISSSLELLIEQNAGERRDNDGKLVPWDEAPERLALGEMAIASRNPKIAVDPAMTSTEARAIIHQQLERGERHAEGRPTPSSIPEQIPSSAFRGCEVVPGEEGFDLRHKASGQTLFYDLWLVTADSRPRQTAAAALTRNAPAKARPPSDDAILSKADEMHARGLPVRDIAKLMCTEPGFENAGHQLVRDLTKGRYGRPGRAGIKSAE